MVGTSLRQEPRKRIAAVTLVRDAEKYIVPHLQMYTGVTQNIALFIPQVLNGGSSGHSLHRDSSETLIQKYCSNVEIHHTNNDVWGASLFNEALELVDADITVMFHADVVISPETWEKLCTLLQDTDYDVYKLDMTKCTINYYHDLNHGVRDCLDIEPIAVKSSVRFNGIYGVPTTNIYTIEDLEVHHFTGWKGIFATQDWLDGKIPSESGVYIDQLKPQTGWIKCPLDENSFRLR